MKDQKIMRKVSFTMPEDLVDELDRYAEAVGMTRSSYLNLASVIGMRAIARQFMPEAFLTPELIQKFQASGMGMPEQDEANQVELGKVKSVVGGTDL